MSMKKMNELAEFLSFFKSIPDDKWCSGAYHLSNGQRCALGHLGILVPDHDGKAQDVAQHNRRFLEGKVGSVPTINDDCNRKFRQTHPKERVLAAIREKMQQEKDVLIAATTRAPTPVKI